MKLLIGIIGIIVAGGVILALWSTADAPVNSVVNQTNTKTATDAAKAETVAQTERLVFTEGTYIAVPEKSIINWAGKKPLIEGYINNGSIGVKEGSVSVGTDSVTGKFTVDMNTLSVSDTPTKEGKESALEGHLRSDDWFDVTTYPEATFEIINVSPRPDSDTTFVYDVEGNLTIKGITNTLQFPAIVYLGADGLLYANADFEIDRTAWDITFGSGSLFNDLADNVIDDMVALSFTLVAESQ